MATIKLNDVEFYYELHGEGEPLILIAGYTCDHLFWGAMLSELKQLFQILIFDNRGVGRTKDTGIPLTVEMMADDTMALTRKLGLKCPNILGQSMGGAIAQIIARKYGNEINKIILLNSSAKFNSTTLFALKSLLNLRKDNVAFDLLVDASMPWFFSSDFFELPKNITRFKEILKNNPYLQSIDDQQRQYKALEVFDSRSWLHEIKNPTHIIAAENDIIALVKENQQLATGIKNNNLTIITGGHSSPIEQPKEICKIVRNFLKSRVFDL